jgi:FAD/FMN-containing dehydrogenase/Fe-S oxidoreductase
MDQERTRIQEDLRGLISGPVHCDDLSLQLYASDASIYQIRPLGVVRPRSTADVAACLQYAHENAIPVHARGAGTGLAGESLGPGLVIDFAYGMRRILATGEQSVRVQPGVVHGVLNAHLRSHGRLFGPDPATSDVTTMGSVVAIDASGSHALRYGSARQHVKRLQIVLADGHVMDVGQHSVTGGSDRNEDPRRTDLVRQLADLLSRHADLIAKWQPRAAASRSGYGLRGALHDGLLELAHLVVGSEGTLALITEATVATQPLVKHRGVVLLLFDKLEAAARAVLEILPLEPSACDLMDRRHLSLARESDVRYELLIPPQSEAVLLVEQDGDDAAEVRRRLAQTVLRVQRKKRLATGARTALDPEVVDLYTRLPRQFVPTLARMKGARRPLPFVEDLAVPPPALPELLVTVQNSLKRHHVTASLLAHVGHGQLHVRPLLDLADPADVVKMQRLADDLVRAVIDAGGTVSGEHADGLSRTPYLAQQFGPLMDVFREVKQIFDPASILNPGKIVATRPGTLAENLRPAASAEAARPEGPTQLVEPPPTLPLRLRWQPHEMAEAARQCNGCGACRAQSSEVRMCPIFRLAPSEEASPRAKANLVRAILTGQLDPGTLAQEELKEVADLCVHCHMCRLECPSEVDIPKLMVEVKSAFVETNGLRPGDWFMTRIDLLSDFGNKFRTIVNWAIANRQARWLLEKTVGIAQGRKLPRFARQSFMEFAGRRPIGRISGHGDPKVLYFVDTYANYCDTQLAEATVAILQHNGIAVYVHPRQRHSAMPMIAAGAINKARRVAQHNVSLLAEAVRQGYTIVASEPTATLCLTREYPHLLDDEDARLVAAHSSDVCHYLWQRHQQGKLQLDLVPQHLVIGYHAPCHLLALDVGTPGENLLRLIPGVSVHPIDKGCSGMAGTYGLKRENYRNSLRAGWRLISAVRDATIQIGATECSSCKMQMEQATSKPTIHPLKILALAYGLMPEVATQLTARGERLVVT